MIINVCNISKSVDSLEISTEGDDRIPKRYMLRIMVALERHGIAVRDFIYTNGDLQIYIEDSRQDWESLVFDGLFSNNSSFTN